MQKSQCRGAQEELKAAWEQARSIESIREEDGQPVFIGEIRKGNRLYRFFKSPSNYWYETRIGPEELTEYEAILGRKKMKGNRS